MKKIITLAGILFMLSILSASAGRVTVKSGSINATGGMFVNGSTLYVDSVNGRVGVGTTNPGYLLTLSKTTDAANNPVAILSPDFATEGRTSAIWIGKAMSANSAAAFGYRYSTTAGNNGAYIINYGDSPGTGLFVQKGGNVGIGTASPTATLQVNSSNAAGSLLVQNTTGSAFLFVNGTTGNVGIGTASPRAKLHVAGGDVTIDNGQSYQVTSTTGTPISILTVGADHVTTLSSNVNADMKLISNPNGADEGIKFYTDGGTTPDMILLNGGNVGIGTTAPAAKLDMNSTDDAIRLRIIGSRGSFLSSNNAMLRTEETDGTSNPTASYAVRSFYNSVEVFNVRHDGAGYLLAAAWTYGSDRRLKENIISINGSGLDTILKLNPVKFDYINGQKGQLGFIAQDVQQVIPEAVDVVDERTGYLGLKTDFIVPYLVKSIQEQQSQIENLKSENNLFKLELCHKDSTYSWC
jgi:hypothetical protein